MSEFVERVLLLFADHRIGSVLDPYPVLDQVLIEQDITSAPPVHVGGAFHSWLGGRGEFPAVIERLD